MVALHVHDEDSIPAFTDQPQHEQSGVDATSSSRRYCPWGLGACGSRRASAGSASSFPLVAEECGCDLIALGWSRELSRGRAPVVRETLARSHRPVLLVPVQLVAALDDAQAASMRTGATSAA